MVKKKMNLANFNVTFGEDNRPLLDYIDTIVYPALRRTQWNKGKCSSGKEMYFFFENVEIKELDNEYVLVGNIIKKTEVEIKTDHVDGKLTEKNECYSTAPFSRFIILLKNHRMVLIKNQAESPSLKNFESTFKKNAQAIIKEYNSKLTKKEKDLRYPFIIVHVVPLPLGETIKDVLKDVKKIKQFKLRLFPLNGDLDFNNLCKEYRLAIESTGAKTGNMTINSPTSKKTVADMIDTSASLMECSLDVEFKGGAKGKIKSEKFSGVLECEIDEENISEDSDQSILNQAITTPSMEILSDENQSIFRRSMGLIKSLMKKR